jgi:phosphotransferase system HPr (HPr) family protein
VELANKFESLIEIEKRGGPKINAKSILGVLLLEGIQGTEVRVLVTGSDSKEALKAITGLISNGFGDA